MSPLQIFLTLATILLSMTQIVSSQLTFTGMTSQELEIIQNYEAKAALSYGDTCDFELESMGAKVRENAQPFLKKLLLTSIHYGVKGHEDDLIDLMTSIEETREELFAQIQEYTIKVHKSKGLLCNESSTLYCDKDSEECRCGEGQKVKGFSFVYAEGKCAFSKGSGCVPSEITDLTSIGCRKGSSCLTAIGHHPCNFANLDQVASRNPLRYRKISEIQGYSCFCDKS